ncbi:hypothetical protein, variant [Aphanomyces astaci]|uniref:MI domain-containing protein n=1 Tax=Aphanomyces astaci TaxID=112090 RepID=W4H8B3_APHAT|nr:hypothetical protein, variant [Aphanomyces astaci]ETV88132.1 hypothetical protein, variant [Aphanomyces astaci]|eukprot:XP_009822995.1 hypothetical protein, variant [Aphanomyces astaci]
MSDVEKPKFESSLLASLHKGEHPPPPRTATSRKPPPKKPPSEDRQPHARPPQAHVSDSGHHRSKTKQKFMYVQKASPTTDVPPATPSPAVAEAPPLPGPIQVPQAAQLPLPPPPEVKKPFQSSLIASAQSSSGPSQSKSSSSSTPHQFAAKPSTATRALPTASKDGADSRPFQSSLQASIGSKMTPDEAVEAAPKKTLRQSIEEKKLGHPSDRFFTRSVSSRDDKQWPHGSRRQEGDSASYRLDAPKGKLTRQSSHDAHKQGPPQLARQASSEKRETPPSILSRLGPAPDDHRHPPSIHARMGPPIESAKRDAPLPRSTSPGLRPQSSDLDRPPPFYGRDTKQPDRSKSSSKSPLCDKPPAKGGSSQLLTSMPSPPCRGATSSFVKPPVKGSSLVASISNVDALRLQLTSSIALSHARSNSPAHARQALDKVRYTATQLRALNKSPNVPRPFDLVDLTKIVVTPASPRAKSSKSSGRFWSARATTSSVVRIHAGHARGGASQQQMRGGRGGRGDRQRGKGARHQPPPPPPLSDEPIVPFVKSESRWVPSKEDKVKQPKDVQHQVKTLLNKLTRDQFEKITADIAALPLKSLDTLNMLVAMIMDKALEEPNFAQVYADLCVRLHQHLAAHRPPFLHAVHHVADQVWYWTAANRSTFPAFHGPVTSRDECFAGALGVHSKADKEVPPEEVQAPAYYVHKGHLVVVATKAGLPKELYYAAVQVDKLSENEPLMGTYPTEESAIKAAATFTSFKRLLVTRCQHKFDSTEHKPKQADDADDPAAVRAARRTKTLMLGNMRFLGELFKVELIAESVVQQCIFKLLGLELVHVDGGAQAAQTIRMPDEEDLEALCKMLATVGKKFDHKGVKTAMTMILVRMVELSDTPSLPSRIRFLLKDVLEMRDHQWVPRRKELQQKTLQEVRKEAEKLQRLGKNAQHDDLQGKRHRTAHSSLDVAKQNSMLLLRQTTIPDQPPVTLAVDPTNRIKSILQEYLALHDIAETRQCVAELPRDSHLAFVEQALTLALEGKEKDRAAAVDMLVGLYETLTLGATEIQSGLLGTLEFLDDLRIDIPMVHEYCGLILGRMIGAGCFGLSWLQLGVRHLAESGLAGLLVAEVLGVMDDDMGADTVATMLAREELNVAGFLPPDQQSPDAVAAFLKAHDLTGYFYEDDDEEEDDEEVKDALHAMVQEFLVVQDVAEVDACLADLQPHPWTVSLVKTVLNELCECKPAQRPLLLTLWRHVLPHVDPADVEVGLSWWFDQLDDVVVDVPQAAVYVAPVVAQVLHERVLTWTWLATVVDGARPATVVQLVEGVCYALDALDSRDATRQGICDSGVSMDKFASGGRLAPWFT